MPTLLGFHAQYWENNRHRGTVTPAASTRRGAYPLWQSSVIHMVAFGPMLSAFWAKLQWIWQAFKLLWYVDRADQGQVLDWIERWPRYSPQERHVFLRLVQLMGDPAWIDARQAVRATATTLGFNEPAFWKGLSRALKDNPGSAQNTFRHLYAVQILRTSGRVLSNPDLHLLTEAAYHAFTAEPKRTMA